jgi:hypothetical protein
MGHVWEKFQQELQKFIWGFVRPALSDGNGSSTTSSTFLHGGASHSGISSITGADSSHKFGGKVFLLSLFAFLSQFLVVQLLPIS